MHGHTFIAIYERLRRMGVVRSQRDYIARYLGRGKTYMRDIEARDGLSSWISTTTTCRLSARLDQLRDALPASLREEVSAMIGMIARDRYVAQFLG